DRVDAEHLQGVELLADLARAEVGGDRGAGDPGHHHRGDEGGEPGEGGQAEEAPEAVEGAEEGEEVGGLQAGGAEAEGEGGDQHREPAELQCEQELADELAPVRVGGPDRRGDRLRGQDHHVPDLLEERLGGQECPVDGGSDHPAPPDGPLHREAAAFRRSYRPRIWQREAPVHLQPSPTWASLFVCKLPWKSAHAWYVPGALRG